MFGELELGLSLLDLLLELLQLEDLLDPPPHALVEAKHILSNVTFIHKLDIPDIVLLHRI